MRRQRSALIASLIVILGAVGTVVPSQASQFPASLYPPPLKARAGGALSACPNPSGLEPFDARANTLAVRIARSYGHVSLAAALRDSDRAWWPEVRRDRGKPEVTLTEAPYGPGSPLGTGEWGGLAIGYSCGQALVAKSLSVVIGPHPRPDCDCARILFFVDRRGRSLLYYVH